jgi:hypothetical protein
VRLSPPSTNPDDRAAARLGEQVLTSCGQGWCAAAFGRDRREPLHAQVRVPPCATVVVLSGCETAMTDYDPRTSNPGIAGGFPFAGRVRAQ